MDKIKILVISILAILLLPVVGIYAQEEEPTVTDTPVLYEQIKDDMQNYTGEWESTSALINQDLDDDIANLVGTGMLAAFTGIYLTVGTIFFLATYIFWAIALMKIGNELKYKHPWFAWVPILNAIMLFELGDKNPLLLLLLLIPVLGPFIVLILMILAYANIAAKRGYDKLIVLLILIPLGGLILLYLLAWRPKTK